MEHTYLFNGKITQNNNNYYVNSTLFTTFAALIVYSQGDKVLVFIIIYNPFTEMRKFYYSLLMLFMGITTAAFAQQEEAAEIQQWDGSTQTIAIGLSEKRTFEYAAAEDGTLYVYVCEQSSNGYIPVSIWGGLYSNGAYDTNSPLQDAGSYENGVGLYGWINVSKGAVVRFTITAAEKGTSDKIELDQLEMESAFFPNNFGGKDWKNPIALSQNKKVTLPVYDYSSTDVLPDLNHATFCSFQASVSGVASIFTKDYLIYYSEEKAEYTTEDFKRVVQDAANNDHEFIVEKGKTYIVVLPNSRPLDVTFKMTQEGLGTDPKFPNPINEFPKKVSLKKGDNYFDFSHDLIGDNCMLEIAVAAGWKGSITYMEDPSENSEELTSNTVTGEEAVTFVKNVDPRYLYGNKLIVNFKVTDKSSVSNAATLTLRAPKDGESFDKAIAAKFGENAINGPAGDYWFAYTAEMDAEFSFATTGTLKHVNFSAGVEQMVADNVYRVDEGETIYVCVTTKTAEANTFTISGEAIMDGDYCDRPIYFELGESITVNGRGRDCFHSFTAQDNGFAVFTSVNWSIQFRDECGGRTLNPERAINDIGDDIEYTYKLPIAKDQSYIVEVSAISDTITVGTKFEEAAEGEIYATAVEVKNLNDTIKIDYDFEKIKWYKLVADKDGFYTVKSKLGYNANMKTKIGNNGTETSAGDDNSFAKAYNGGYRISRVYLTKGQTLYIYTKTGRENIGTIKDPVTGTETRGDVYAHEFKTNLYLVASFAEARPGEDVAIAIEAKAYTEYTILKNDADGYEQWYVYTIPAGEKASIKMTASKQFISSSLNFLKENAAGYLKKKSEYSDEYDYIQNDITDKSGATIGKSYEFAVIDTDRTFYIKASMVNAMYDPVVWTIECNEKDTTDVVVEEAPVEAPVIYDLMGRRVENPGKGIYIINGVKRVIK